MTPPIPANDNGPLGNVYTLDEAANDNLVSHNRLVEVLHYDPETGIFTWRVRKGNVRAGSVAGKLASNGYWRIKIDRIDYPAHRLAWFYVTGRWPAAVIDHINRDQTDNAFANLREAYFAQNQHNRVEQINNTSGLKGVSFVKKTGHWRADIMRHGKSRYLGSHRTKEEASAAYDAAAVELHGVFARNSSGALHINDNGERVHACG